MKALSIVQQYHPKVTLVQDGLDPIQVEVQVTDVASASIKNHKCCALAQACKRSFNLDGVIVSRSTVYLIMGNQATRYKITEAIAREIVAFDRGAAFAPGTYTLKEINRTARLGYRAKYEKGRTGSRKRTTGKSRFQHITTGIRASLGT